MKRLSGWDAMLLYSETTNIPTHTLKIAVVDTGVGAEGLNYDQFRRVVGRTLPALAPLNFRLVGIPFRLHHPMWTEDHDVDLDRQLRRVELPPGGGRVALDRVIGEIAEECLSRDGPLWELVFVEGLAPGKSVVVAKIHHALADGVASANLMALAMDASAGGDHLPHAQPRRQASSGELVRAAMRDHAVQLGALPSVIGSTVRGVRRVRRGVRGRAQRQGFAKAFSAPGTFMNHQVSSGRRFATATVSLGDAKQLSKALGITINDLVLATAAGGLRELLLRNDGRADEPLVASVPVNTDPSPNRISGNALGALFVSLPVHVEDVAERVRLTRVATIAAKENNELLGPELVGKWVEYLPPGLAPRAFEWLAQRERKNNLYNLSISNVKGPSAQGVIGGSPITEFYSVGPLTAGSAANITVWSYVDQLNFTILTDDRTVDSGDEVSCALLASYYRIRRMSGIHNPPHVPETAMSQCSLS